MYIIHVFLNSKIHYHYYTLFCLFAGECEISRLFFSTLLFDESESDIYSLEHCEICEVTRVDNSLSDVWVEILREDNEWCPLVFHSFINRARIVHIVARALRVP